MNVHFIGVGGVSMSALAAFTRMRGHTVTGSDSALPGGHGGLPDACDLVVKNAAIKPDNPELKEAARRGVKVIDRAELLGRVAAGYKTVIAVAGSHGKTTASAMLASIFLDSDPTVHIGGELPLLARGGARGNYRLGREGGIFITEACEYKRSFLSLYPDVAVALNIDADHLDYYRDADDVASAFAAFLGNIKAGGTAVVNGEDARALKTAENYGGKYVTFGLNNGDYTAGGLRDGGAAEYSFDLIEKGRDLGRIKLKVAGTHNVYNAIAAAAAARVCGAGFGAVKAGLERFTGVNRRFQRAGKLNGRTVILDYAHHPAEIRAVVSVAETLTDGGLVTVFQPHTYSRTKALLPDFVTSLSAAGKAIIAPVYSAREKPADGVTGEVLARELKNAGADAEFAPSLGAAAAALNALPRGDGIILLLGAGDVDTIIKDLPLAAE